jgi:tetratricopeptide (TPR) repeat protein
MSRRIGILLLLWACSCALAFAGPEQWVEVKSPHFTLITDSSDKQGRRILDQFERMRWLFQTMFPAFKVDPPQPILVIAVRNGKDMEALEPAAYLGRGKLLLAGLFLSTPDKNYVLLRLDAEGEHPYDTIYHEYTHLQFRDAGGWMPIWLNEGFAEFLQNTEFRDKDVILGEPSADNIYYLREHGLIPLATLFKVDYKSPYYHEEDKGSVFYAESWALTHFLELSDKQAGTHRVPDYVNLVRRHEDPVAAAQAAFGDLGKLQSALDSYISRANYQELRLSSAAAPIDESTYQSRPLTAGQADARRADFLVGVDRKPDARALLDSVLKADPANAEADTAMGDLESREGDLAAARGWYAKAAVNSPQDFQANYNFAASALRSGNSSDPQVEASLRAAIQVNPGFAPAYDQLGMLFAMRHEHLDEAYTLYTRAMQLDPGNLIYRLNASSLLMTLGRYDDATTLLTASLKVQGSANEMEMVKSRLAQVQSIQALGARPSAMVTAAPTGVVDVAKADTVVDIAPAPKHPTEAATGPKHAAVGVIRQVKCSYPAEIEFQVQTGKTPVEVYSNNYFKIDVTASGFNPTGDMNPCNAFEGMKARVQYAESSDKSIDGQVVAVELRK